MKKHYLSLVTFIVTLFFLFSSLSFVSCKQANSSGGTGTESTPEVPKIVNAEVPTISNQPQNTTVKTGVNYTLSVTASVSDGVLSYVWYKATTEDGEGEVLPLKTENTITDSYTLQEGEESKVLYFYCKVTNTISDNDDGGTKTQTVTSSRASVTINNKINAKTPTINTQPVAYDGTYKNYSVSVAAESSDSGNLTYKWYSSDTDSVGTVISGATSSSYSPSKPASQQQTKYYYCVITNTITNNGDGGTKTASVTTNRVKVVTYNGIGYEHISQINNSQFAPYDDNGLATAGFGWNDETWDLGSKVTGSSTTFAVYSANATKVLLEIYDTAYGNDAKYDYWMEKGSDNIWRAKISGLGSGTIYAFRCWGPNWTYSSSWTRGDSSSGYVSDCDSSGNRFNPNKVLFDPYAKEMTHDQSNATALNGKTTAILTSGATNRNKDSGKYAPKGYVISDSTSTGTKPALPAKDSIIYEAHVRGLTKHSSTASLSTILSSYSGFSGVQNIPEAYRGTYKGATYMAPYLKALGINTIELLPVHETDNDANPTNGAGGNFWGYMTFDYFAPDRRYSYDKTAGGPTKEFKEMVKAFHDEGIEVYLDVVYNHTGEGGPWQKDSNDQCSVVSMRGFDNSTYYCLVNGNPSSYWETSGCGNNMQCDNSTVRTLILDSLKYWITDMGVDGFRFDLATILGRVNNGSGSWDYSSSAKTLTDIASLGILNNVEMIAESWDCGSNSYQVGNFPSGWAGWNGRYRDTMRKFVNNGVCKDSISYADGLYGDAANFGTSEPSVNFIVAHDGFTLADLCSYSGNGNANNATLTWPFGPSDGGDSALNEITNNTETMRRQRIRNFFTMQMFSAGIPMIVYGDEFGRTQNGNNNPYNIDSVCTWNNYSMVNTSSPQAVSTGSATSEGGTYTNKLGTYGNTGGKNGNFDFARYVMNLRVSDSTLKQITGATSNFSYKKNICTDTGYDSSSDRCAGVLISGTNKYYMMINMYTENVNFTFPAPSSGKKWTRIIDTASWAETNNNYWADTDTTCTYPATGTYGVNAWSIVVLKEVSQ